MAEEKNIETALRQSLSKLDQCIVYKNFSNMNTGAGRPDLSGVYRGRYFAIEVKRTQGGHFKENQKRQLLAIADAGGIAILTSMTKLDFIFKHLDEKIAKYGHDPAEIKDLSAQTIWRKFAPLLIIRPRIED